MSKVYIVQYRGYDDFDRHYHINHGVYEEKSDAQEAVKILKDNNKVAFYKEHEIIQSVKKYKIKQFQIALHIPEVKDGDDSDIDLDEFYTVKTKEYTSLTPPKNEFVHNNYFGDLYSDFGYLDDLITIEVDAEDENLINKVELLTYEIAHAYGNLIDYKSETVSNEDMDRLEKTFNKHLKECSCG